MGRPRPWLAAVLSMLYPGLGHAYLREWVRSLLWIVLAVGAVALAMPQDPVADASITDPGSIVTASNEMTAGASTVGLAVVVSVFAACVFDAYSLARSNARRQEREAAADYAECPTCGRELDPELEFCHWCTTRLDGESQD